ncbi:MAG: response regulator, partial [Ginsengibacter sp.]
MIKILLVEDNNEIRENTAEILELASYQVTTAINGKDGYEKALEETPDIIICDIMMPVLDGYGFL